MEDTAKYLIHARITADGVVERSDVVGAVFGQTEGLLGDELDLRDLQQSSKVGRIDVRVDSENGQSFGELTIASSLDKVETAILAASLEAITRVGPCEARVEVTEVEDMRAAKRREVVDRAKELLAESFDESVMDSTEILEEVREARRVERIDDYADLPAGPRVHDSDAVVLVEGRADVLTLLKYGVKNAVAVEGTNVPDAVADLSRERTVTAFLDGDRGGQLILRELAQVGDVDYVAFAPEGRSVEDLARHEVFAALREKVPFDSIEFDGEPGAGPVGSVAATDGSTTPAPAPDAPSSPGEPSAGAGSDDAAPRGDAGTGRDEAGSEPTDAEPTSAGDDDEREGVEREDAEGRDAESTDAGQADAEDGAVEASDDRTVDAAGDGAAGDAPRTLRDHVREVVRGRSNHARLLDAEFETLAEVPASETFDAVSAADEAPFAVVVDGELTQRVLDVAAQRGVEQVVAESTGEFVKRPTSVRVLTADQLFSS